jgi:shikimate kinase
MVIALVGYMGSGKSTVGKALAASRGMRFTDLDDYIEQRLGQSIPEVFRAKGELFFRKKEHELLREWLEGHDSGVLALGGGTPCYAGNMDMLMEHTPYVVYLQLSVPALADRLRQEQQQRPLIAHLSAEELPEFIGKHLFERAPFYARAPYVVNCEDRAAKAIVQEISRLLV